MAEARAPPFHGYAVGAPQVTVQPPFFRQLDMFCSIEYRKIRFLLLIFN